MTWRAADTDMKEDDMAKDTKAHPPLTKAEAEIAKALHSGFAGFGSAAPQAGGNVEARLSALEAYVRDNARAMGWPEFKG
jgi:hypothetical protein